MLIFLSFINKFGLIGSGYSLDEGFIFIMEDATTPNEISTSATINSNFGLVMAGVYIKDTSGHVELPAPFNIIFSLSEAETSEE